MPYFYGDGSIREFINLTKQYPAGDKVTAYYNNTDPVNAQEGAVEVVVEEI